MPITPVASTIPAQGVQSAAPTRAPKQTMDADMFMNMLVIQLKNQDPSSPMDTNAMIGQTTQLAMMEKLTSLESTSGQDFSLQMRSAAAALIGKTVTYAGPDGSSVTGTATSVSFTGSVPAVSVNGSSIALDALTGIGN
jgi:flagellar basal-body rod modification protein FlgD